MECHHFRWFLPDVFQDNEIVILEDKWCRSISSFDSLSWRISSKIRKIFYDEKWLIDNLIPVSTCVDSLTAGIANLYRSIIAILRKIRRKVSSHPDYVSDKCFIDDIIIEKIFYFIEINCVMKFRGRDYLERNTRSIWS
jgi:hypothetical protein